ncbi:hypothetical protein M9R32_13920 [Paenisporosarcina quisquiliarum]|uniref:Uncharacterized protein n=1 Tax=Paenisporosarcina quisquiliarum TaxID=365346 RepID=A0A9X3REW2_9BACL|nr:hypothetical protein [Paenisporosarcina quisquiliarum]MCZ8538289.1 hypothetical protein [Paenisporosarcina quisquiliarum]
MAEDYSIWEIILPYDYVSSRSDQGLIVAHRKEMDQSYVPFPIEITLSSFIDMEKSDLYFFINELKFINEFGNIKIIPVPEKMVVWYAFRWFEYDNRYSDYVYQPTIFQSRHKLVTFCTYSMNSDGLANHNILTVNLDENTLHDQWWDDEWTEELEKKIPSALNPVEWGQNNLQIYLNASGDELIANSSFNQIDVVIHFIWNESSWFLNSIRLEPLDTYINRVGFKIEKL